MSTQLDLQVWDADNHLYEAEDALTRHLPAEYSSAVTWAQIAGRTKLVIKGTVTDTIPNPTYEVVPTPGSWADYFRGVNPEGKSLRELANPIRCPEEFRRPEERLALMDSQGLAGALLFPTTAGMLEERMIDDIPLTVAVMRAYNRWLLDDWTFDFKGRILSTPVISLCDVRAAVLELEWALDHGARAVLVNPRPVATTAGRLTSPAHPAFDEFWNLAAEQGVPVLMHACDSGYTRYTRDWGLGSGEYLPFVPNAFETVVYEDARSILDTMASFVCHGLFWRNPGLRIGVVENGGSWVPRLLDLLQRASVKMPAAFDDDPVATFKRHVWVNPFHEDRMSDLVDLMGEDKIMFGSDFPHPEGLADPAEYSATLTSEGFSAAVTSKIMGENLLTLLQGQSDS